jgi:hypothetical protein
MTRKITLEVQPGREALALLLVDKFVHDQPDNHHTLRPDRHGVIWKFPDDGPVFYVYGNPQHIRVKQEPDA